ncbi:GAP family protein [Candidatus Woesearchaeota archaeon]|nr:GAP family protein [Candidatus Woesearchaeota archaeon]
MNRSSLILVLGSITAIVGMVLTNTITSNATIELPTMPVVITTALVDSINPCAIGVLILLIGTLLSLSHNRKKMLAVGLIYIAAVYVTYFLAGIGLLFFLQKIGASVINVPLLGPIAISNFIGIIVALIVIIGGLIEVKDFFWYGKGFSLSISPKNAEKIKKYVKNVTIPGAIILGIFVAGVELPCTGGPYLAITTLLSKIGLNFAIAGYLMLYNLIFVLPLIIILLFVYFGANTKKIKNMKQSGRKWMRLFTGIIMIGLGILLIMFSLGIINFVIT